MKKRKSRKKQKLWLVIIALIVIIAIGISNDNIRNYIQDVIDTQDVLAVATNAIGDIGKQRAESTKVSFSLYTIPNFKDEPYVVINFNIACEPTAASFFVLSIIRFICALEKT